MEEGEGEGRVSLMVGPLSLTSIYSDRRLQTATNSDLEPLDWNRGLV